MTFEIYADETTRETILKIKIPEREMIGGLFPLTLMALANWRNRKSLLQFFFNWRSWLKVLKGQGI